MKSFQGMLVSSLLLVSCSGCVQVAALIELDPTGSGKLLIRYLISEQLSDPGNFISLKVNETPVETESSKKKSILSQVEEQAESLAAKLGDGISYVGRKQIEKEKGWVGIQTEYRFADINQLKLPIVLQHDRKDDKNEKASEDKANEISLLSMSDAGHFCFRFEPASAASEPNQLTIWREKQAELKPVTDDPFAAAGLELTSAPTTRLNQAFSNAIVKGFLNGFRLTTMMKVNGKIEETNSTNRPKPDSIVLSDLDFGKLATSKDFDRAVAEKWGYDRMMAESPLAARGIKLNEKIHVHFK